MFRLAALALVLPVALAACDMGHGMDMMTARNDVEFIDMMAPHHAGATEMSAQVLARGSRADVAALARRIGAAQEAEIAEMRRIRRELTGSDRLRGGHDDPHMDADIRAMRGLSGNALDRFFLEHMIPHHAGALVMAHNALPNLAHARLQVLARQMIQDQADEIEEMRAMLAVP